MPNTKHEVPPWLLNDLFLGSGTFNEDRTIVTGRPNAHRSAVLNIGHGAPSVVSDKLTEEQMLRLERELGPL